jgi:hypothetical protein
MALAALSGIIEGVPWPEGDVEPRGGHDDGKREYNGQRVRLPPCAPADHPRVELSQPAAWKKTAQTFVRASPSVFVAQRLAQTLASPAPSMPM